MEAGGDHLGVSTPREAAPADGAIPAAIPKRRRRFLWAALVVAGMALCIVTGGFLSSPALIKQYLVRPLVVPSAGMAPAIMAGDRVLVNMLAYRVGSPKRGDIVVFSAPDDPKERMFIKRVVASGGQTVELRRGQLYVDRQEVAEPYVTSSRDPADLAPITVPDGQYFLLGDNRSNSSDSRHFGPVPASAILGKAFYIYWPKVLEHGQRRAL